MADLSSLIGADLLQCGKRERDHSFKQSGGKEAGQTLLFIQEGALGFRTKGQHYRIGKQELLCYDSDIRWEHLPEDQTPCSYIVFDVALVGTGYQKLKLADIGFPSLFKASTSKTVRRLIEKLALSFYNLNDDRKTRCATLLLAIFLELRNVVLPETAVKASSDTRLHFRIRETLGYINSNYKKPITLHSLADHVGLHPVYLSRLFKKQVGVSPHRYILEYKIRKAKDFLLMYDEAAVYTGQELGFQDYSHFFKTFKRMTGKTPIEFVRQSGKHYDPR